MSNLHTGIATNAGGIWLWFRANHTENDHFQRVYSVSSLSAFPLQSKVMLPESASMPLEMPIMASPTRFDAEVVELSLLLPRWQADALEDAAHRKGMTTGQMLRRVIADLFNNTSEAKA